MFLSTGCSLLRAEGFSYSLGLLYGGLGMSKLQFLIKKISSYKLFSILGHQTLDPDPESGSAIRKYARSGSVSRSALNQSGSETLVGKLKIRRPDKNNRETAGWKLERIKKSIFAD